MAAYDEVVPPDQYLVSKSALFTFEMCPRRFQYAHLLKLPSDDSDEPMSQALSDGIRYHDLFAKAFERDFAPTQGQLATQLFDKELLTDEICQKFSKAEEQRLKQLGPDNWRPVATELYVEDKSERMKGYVDRVDYIGPNSPLIKLTGKPGYMITDYKPRSGEIREELAFYHVPSETTLDGSVVLHACYGYRDGQWRIWAPRQTDINDMLRRKNIILDAISESNLPKRETRYCKWCSYPLRCLAESVELEEDILNV